MSQAENEDQRKKFVLSCLPTVISCTDWTINLWGQLVFNSGKKPISEPTQLSRAATQARIGTRNDPGNNSNNGQPRQASKSTFSKAGLELINQGLATRTRKMTNQGFTDGTGTPYIWTPTIPPDSHDPNINCNWPSLYSFLAGLFRRNIVLAPHHRAAAVKLASHVDERGRISGSDELCAALGVSRFSLCLEPVVTLAATKQLKIAFDIQAKTVTFKAHQIENESPEQIQAAIDELRAEIWYPELCDQIIIKVARTKTNGQTITPKQRIKMYREMLALQEDTSAPLLKDSLERMVKSRKNIAAWLPYLKAVIKNNRNAYNNHTPAVTQEEKLREQQLQAQEILLSIANKTGTNTKPEVTEIAEAVDFAEQLARLSAGSEKMIEQNILLAIKRGTYYFSVDATDQIKKSDLDLLPEYAPGTPWSEFRKQYSQ
jgi:hypothetical protein